MSKKEQLVGLAVDTLRAAFTVSRWTIGMLVLGGLASLIAATVLLDEAGIWVRSGLWGSIATGMMVVSLVILPFVWCWLGKAHGIRLACLEWLGPRAEPAIALLLRAVGKRATETGEPLSPQTVLAALRRPARLSGPARWLAWLIRWQLDLDRTEAHLEQAAQQAAQTGVPSEQALAGALAADLGERWLQPDPALLWALALAESAVVLTLAWLW